MNSSAREDGGLNYEGCARSASPSLALRRDSDQVLGMFPYWTPPVQPWKPVKTVNSSLRMAVIVGERLYQGLRFEGEVLLLTPRNWRHVLRYGRPDFLLMESTWETATGHWHMAQSAPTREAVQLVEIVETARGAGIPTVYWLTQDRVYHHHYKAFARHFDHVFCADAGELGRLTEEGIQANYLPPCVQPALYNPFRYQEDYDALDLGVVFDGWGDLDRKPDELRVLDEIRHDHVLSILESRYQLTRRRLDAFPEFRSHILGCVTRQGRITALKYARAYITFAQSLSTPTTQQWMALEATASRLPVVHLGELAKTDVRSDLVLASDNEDEFLLELYRLGEDKHYRDRRGHLAWRETYRDHTYSHRLRTISERLGIEHDWVEYPKVSLITPTYRSALLPRCLDTFERQSYPNKELVVVFNGSEPPSYRDLGLDGQRADVTLSYVPGDYLTGGCLVMGHYQATGEFFFKVDDDDYYSDNYILDLMMVQRAVDGDRFGKPPGVFTFANEPFVYQLKTSRARPYMLTIGQALWTGRIWIGGNSISGPRAAFEVSLYSPMVIGAADTILNFDTPAEALVFTADDFNLVAERRDDARSHTWRIDNDRLKEKSEVYADLREFTV